ncbi:dynamin family protein [Leptolyngbya sp. AN03gr2]|uniref:dynamin family protein n=1 Tax=unclassified Leptolyngbya TaxID=2650499 RepID=UPI003D310DC2
MLSQELIDAFNCAIGSLELESRDSLRCEIEALYDSRSAFQIAVFGPFNYGKSTLLNAILGERALPIALIPTTGAAIRVCYGEMLATKIRFTDGREVVEAGTDVLKQFAILDDDRRMRDDVSSVEVFCPHPLLQSGVELIDLPGTNDREAQDELVRSQLFKADLVIQVLDGRKLMTLGEREHLRDWLLDRGITTVIFVVNFLNLLEPEDQKQVYQRLRFVAESFRAELPDGVSNLYRVDALPALRSRLKGDQAAAQSSGLPIFETALHTIAAHYQLKQTPQTTKVQRLIDQVRQALQVKIDTIETQIASETTVAQQRFEIQQKAKALIEKGFAASVLEFHTWLEIDNLLATYQFEVATALQSQTFRTWETGEFKRTAIDYQQAIVKWVHQACEIFERDRPHQLLVTFPTLEIEPPSSTEQTGLSDEVPIAVATGVGWVLGGPIGAAVFGGASYLLDKALDQFSSTSETNAQIYQELAKEYLIHFSRLNLAALTDYQKVAERTFAIDLSQPQLHQNYQLQLLRSTLERFDSFANCKEISNSRNSRLSYQ